MLVTKVTWITLGWLSFVMGLLGIFVPLLPTTPFILLAAYCFSKGSTKIHHWLLSQPRFGPMIRDWQERGVIQRPVKLKAIFLVLVTFSLLLYFLKTMVWVKVVLISTGTLVATFIFTRPED